MNNMENYERLISELPKVSIFNGPLVIMMIVAVVSSIAGIFIVAKKIVDTKGVTDKKELVKTMASVGISRFCNERATLHMIEEATREAEANSESRRGNSSKNKKTNGKKYKKNTSSKDNSLGANSSKSKNSVNSSCKKAIKSGVNSKKQKERLM